MFLILIFIVCFTGLGAGQVWAEGDAAETYASSLGVVRPPSAAGAFDKIKADISFHVNENKRLRAEQDGLKKEYYDIQRRLQQNKKERQALEDERLAQKKVQENKKVTLQKLYDEVDKANAEILLKESQIAYLRRQSIDVEEELKPVELQLADLNTQKRELEVEWQDMEHRFRETEREAAQDKVYLQNSLQMSLEKEKELIQLLREAEGEELSMPRQIKQLKQENHALEYQIVDLQKQHRQKEERVAAYEQQGLAFASDEELRLQKEAEKEKLVKRKEELEVEFAALDEQINNSLAEQDRKRRLINEMMTIDKTNQVLRNDITTLKTQLKELKPSR